MDDSNLLFLISQPRSGSTLLQNIISNNDFINTISEPWILLPYLSVLNPKIHKGIYDSNLSKIGIEEYIQKLDINQYFKNNVKDFLINIYKPLFLPENVYVLDKTPRYYEIVDEITEYFPNSKIIVLKRNPFDVLNSIITTWNVKNLYDLYKYSRDILFAPFLIQNFLDNHKESKNIIEVYYENIIKEPDREIANIFNWLKLKYDPAFLEYKKNNKAEGRMGDQVGVKKYSSIKQSKSQDKELIENSKPWKNFFVGYANYLNNKKFKDFTKYSFENSKPTRIFNDFLLANKVEYYDRERWSLKNLYKLLKFKIKDKIYSYSV